ncbi:MAG: dienelactone hydrolase family protein [Verrucomicrobiota bacterium]
MKEIILLPLIATVGFASLVEKEIAYEIDGKAFAGRLIYDKSEVENPTTAADQSPVAATNSKGTAQLPGIVFFPNWMGPETAATLEKAHEVASAGFAVFIADMYSVDVRPTNAGEASKAAGFVRSDRKLMRLRAQKAIDVFKELADEHPIDSERTLAIGFCFGGGTVLELARSGTDTINGAVSFHGDLMSPTLKADAEKVKIPLLILHGADDPYVPQSDVQTFIQVMQDAGVDDWNLVQFSGAVHSFTDPTAQSEGARYHARTAKRAFGMMDDFAEEVLGLSE